MQIHREMLSFLEIQHAHTEENEITSIKLPKIFLNDKMGESGVFMQWSLTGSISQNNAFGKQDYRLVLGWTTYVHNLKIFREVTQVSQGYKTKIQSQA